MKKLTKKKAHQECIKLWDDIVKAIESGELERYRINKKYQVRHIKIFLRSEEGWDNDCPLCEYYQGSKRCPLYSPKGPGTGAGCRSGCYTYGFEDREDGMTPKQIKKFRDAIKKKVNV